MDAMCGEWTEDSPLSNNSDIYIYPRHKVGCAGHLLSPFEGYSSRTNFQAPPPHLHLCHVLQHGPCQKAHFLWPKGRAGARDHATRNMFNLASIDLRAWPHDVVMFRVN